MEQQVFEQAVLDLLHQVPVQYRDLVLTDVQTLVNELKKSSAGVEERQFDTERHRALRRLTATIQGRLADAVAAERDERG
jgi:hypothetical protein